MGKTKRRVKLVAWPLSGQKSKAHHSCFASLCFALLKAAGVRMPCFVVLALPTRLAGRRQTGMYGEDDLPRRHPTPAPRSKNAKKKRKKRGGHSTAPMRHTLSITHHTALATHHHWQTAGHDLKLLSRPNSIRDRNGVRNGIVLVAPSCSRDGVRPGFLLRLRKPTGCCFRRTNEKILCIVS